MNDIWGQLREEAVVCNRCATQFDVEQDILRTNLETSQATGHFSIRGLMDQGYEVLTF